MPCEVRLIVACSGPVGAASETAVHGDPDAAGNDVPTVTVQAIASTARAVATRVLPPELRMLLPESSLANAKPNESGERAPSGPGCQACALPLRICSRSLSR